MNSKVIKFVAGAGKTTWSIDYLKENKNGLYLAFTTSVVDDVRKSGCLSLTIHSLFFSFILPKMTFYIPIIAPESNFILKDEFWNQGVTMISFDDQGNIYNQSKRIIEVSLNTTNDELYGLSEFKNQNFLKTIFQKDKVCATHEQFGYLYKYIINNYPDQILEILSDRFDYIIFDEAQDLKVGFLENFAKLLHGSDIDTFFLGDPNQNINGGGEWFEGLFPDEEKCQTYRCSEGICEWVRGSLGIEIYGKDEVGDCYKVDISEVSSYDNGKRTLLFSSNNKFSEDIIKAWSGPLQTIRSAKGITIYDDVVIIGKSMNFKSLYTAVTRTTRSAYHTVSKINR